MGIRPDDSKTAVRALLRRDALLAAYLDALNRIDGPNHRHRAAELRLEHRPRRDLVPIVNQIRTYWWCSPPRIGQQRM